MSTLSYLYFFNLVNMRKIELTVIFGKERSWSKKYLQKLKVVREQWWQ